MNSSTKLTILGILGTIVFAIPGLQQLLEEGLTSGNWKVVGAKILSGVIVGLIGYFAKGFDVTGGTTASTLPGAKSITNLPNAPTQKV